MARLFPAIVVGLALLAGGAARGEDWPEFRGPTGQGLSSAHNVPVEWSDTKNVAWKQTIPGNGWSSPVVSGGRIYLTTAVAGERGAGQSLRALCLDAAAGSFLWNVQVFATQVSKGHQKNSQASPTPVVESGRLYVHFGHQGTACLDLTGKVLWRNTGLAYEPVHGNGGSPALVDNALIFSCDGAANPFVVALDKNTGRVQWKVNRVTGAKKKFSFSTPLVITTNADARAGADSRKQVISAGSGAVCAYDPKNGRELWRVRYDEGYSVIPRPVYGNGLLYVATGFEHPMVMAIRPDGHGDVTETHVVWTLARGAPHTPSLLLVGENLYLVSDGGIASCVDAQTGAVRWSERIGGNYSASPLFAGGRIYFQSEEGVGTVLQAGETFEPLASNALHERTLASCAVADNALFIRAEQHLYRIQP